MNYSLLHQSRLVYFRGMYIRCAYIVEMFAVSNISLLNFSKLDIHVPFFSVFGTPGKSEDVDNGRN